MKHYWLIALTTLLPPVAAVADPLSWSASTLPLDGNIEGTPGSTIGWGYTITNPDSTWWLLLTTLDASPFQHGTATSLFDFPEVAPGTTVSLGFDGVNGLYGLTWDADAPIGFMNSGLFTLGAQWYDGDPFNGGVLVDIAPAIDLPFTASVVAPEPGGFVLMLLTLSLCLIVSRRRPGFAWAPSKSRNQRPLIRPSAASQSGGWRSESCRDWTTSRAPK